MTQNDRPYGRLTCLVGIAPLHPSEFVIFRIGEKTGRRRDPRFAEREDLGVETSSLPFLLDVTSA